MVDKGKGVWVSRGGNCGKVNIGGNLMENKGCLVKSVTKIAVCLWTDRVISGDYCGSESFPYSGHEAGEEDTSTKGNLCPAFPQIRGE